jgi:hypothetical protein
MRAQALRHSAKVGAATRLVPSTGRGIGAWSSRRNRPVRAKRIFFWALSCIPEAETPGEQTPVLLVYFP